MQKASDALRWPKRSQIAWCASLGPGARQTAQGMAFTASMCRFIAALRTAGNAHWDIERTQRWNDVLPAGSNLTANSSVNTATGFVVPASLTGIGYVTIETGDYPLGVN